MCTYLEITHSARRETHSDICRYSTQTHIQEEKPLFYLYFGFILRIRSPAVVLVSIVLNDFVLVQY